MSTTTEQQLQYEIEMGGKRIIFSVNGGLRYRILENGVETVHGTILTGSRREFDRNFYTTMSRLSGKNSVGLDYESMCQEKGNVVGKLGIKWV